ncbi:MAG: cupredoxin domain-containing protein [Candidatus Binatia bacterium]
MRKIATILALGAVLSAGPVFAQHVDNFTVVNIEYKGTKIWLPGTLVVHKGDKVKIKLINNVPGADQHGFTIPAYKILTVVTRGEPKEIEFVADKAGIFPFSCQLHAAHVGGRLVVLE